MANWPGAKSSSRPAARSRSSRSKPPDTASWRITSPRSVGAAQAWGGRSRSRLDSGPRRAQEIPVLFLRVLSFSSASFVASSSFACSRRAELVRRPERFRRMHEGRVGMPRPGSRTAGGRTATAPGPHRRPHRADLRRPAVDGLVLGRRRGRPGQVAAVEHHVVAAARDTPCRRRRSRGGRAAGRPRSPRLGDGLKASRSSGVRFGQVLLLHASRAWPADSPADRRPDPTAPRRPGANRETAARRSA